MPCQPSDRHGDPITGGTPPPADFERPIPVVTPAKPKIPLGPQFQFPISDLFHKYRWAEVQRDFNLMFACTLKRILDNQGVVTMVENDRSHRCNRMRQPPVAGVRSA